MPTRRPASIDDKVSADQKYASYIDLQINLDTLMWNNQTTLLTITAFSLGAIGVCIDKSLRFGGLTNHQTLAGVCLLTGILYFSTLIALFRMRFWHERVEHELRLLEEDGYFHRRFEDITLFSASRWGVFIYSCIAVACFCSAIYFATHP